MVAEDQEDAVTTWGRCDIGTADFSGGSTPLAPAMPEVDLAQASEGSTTPRAAEVRILTPAQSPGQRSRSDHLLGLHHYGLRFETSPGHEAASPATGEALTLSQLGSTPRRGADEFCGSHASSRV